MLKITEKILLYQIKKGDEAAFARFYNAYRVNIYRFIYFKVSDEEKAQDLTNETFLKIFNYLQDGEKIVNFRALLFKVARNLIIDFYRTRRAQIPIEEAPEIISSTDTVQQVDQNLAMDNLKKYLSSLKPEYQEVVRLHFFDGLSFLEIAKATGLSEGNARMRAHRGIKQLKKRLKSGV